MTVCVIASDAQSLVDFRGDLMRQMREFGHEIVAVAPEGGFEVELSLLGVSYRQLPFARAGTNLWDDLKLLRSLRALLRELRPDVVFSYGVKPAIYASLAAQQVGIGRIYTLLPGLGYTFQAQGIKGRIMRSAATWLLRRSLRYNRRVIAQNEDDRKELIAAGIVSADRCVRVFGSGVNMDRFAVKPVPKTLTFLMASRLLREKGVHEYCAATRIVKSQMPDVRCVLLGPFDSNPSGLRADELAALVRECGVEYLGAVRDIIPHLAESSVVVLPSYYREGVPRVLLEGMSMGRPLITTDWIGCRDTLIDGETGYLVRPHSAEDLAEKMLRMMRSRERLARMGEASHQLCRARFDVRVINARMLEHLELCDLRTPQDPAPVEPGLRPDGQRRPPDVVFRGFSDK